MMTLSVVDFLRRFPAKPFVVQFVTALKVGDNEEILSQITSYLISAESESEAHAAAQSMVDSLSDNYRNSDGEIVYAKCIGVHSIDELEYLDDDGRLQLGVLQFSQKTLPENLIRDEREDLLLLD